MYPGGAELARGPDPMSTRGTLQFGRHQTDIGHGNATSGGRVRMVKAGRMRRRVIHREETPVILDRHLHAATLERLLDFTSDALVWTDWQGSVRWCNRAFHLLVGHPFPDLLNACIYDLLSLETQGSPVPVEAHPATKARAAPDALAPLGLYTLERSGSTVEVAGASVACGADGGEVFLVIRDVSERKQTEARLAELAHFEELAHYDPVTGLPNRRLFTNLLNRALKRAARCQGLVALLFLDIDRFKLINDTLGHSVGDQLLKAVASKLTQCLRAHDIISRLGGDEFTVILEDLKTLQDIAAIAQRIMESLSSPLQVAGHQVFTSVSIGIALHPTDSTEPETLIKNADTALYVAKEHRACFRFFSPEMHSGVLERLTLNTELRHALQKEQFVLHYQPLYEAKTRKIVGVEALVRWQHPQHGLLYPARFIHIAEETGMVVPLGEWVLKAACAQAKVWQRIGADGLRVAVNVSSRQFQQSNFIEVVRAALQDTALPPHLLEIELTERSLFLDTARTAAILEALHQIGIGIAIDDFGTEYSSLGYLRRLPVHALKIDRSFVHDIARSAEDASIVQAIVALGHCLNLKVIAEGVETLDQVEFLESHACNELQGYYFSKPVRVEEVPALLQPPLRGPAGADQGTPC